MRLHPLVPVVLAMALGSALAADPETAPAAQPVAAPQAVDVSASAPEAPRYTCHQESDIGSMRMHKVCTKVLTDAERIATQDAARNLLPNASLTHPAVGDPTFLLMGRPVNSPR